MKIKFLKIIWIILISAAFSEAGTLTYIDKMERSVRIPVPVERAIFFQTYELIPVLDSWNRVAGIGRHAYKNDLMLATLPDIEKRIPSPGSGIDVNMEVLLKICPDIVITWTYHPEFIRFIEKKGLNVIAIYPENIADLYGVMRLHGKLFGKEAKIDAAISEMNKIFSIIRKRASKVMPEEKRKMIWLGGRMTYVACGVGITNDIFQMIGGINPAGNINQRSVNVSIEQIVAWNPDVIFIWGNAGYTSQEILNNPQWRFIKAVKAGRVYKAPEWSTWSPRLAPVALWMGKRTYPEYYKDIDLDKVTDAFYQTVFGIPYSKVKKIEE